ncbi:MAG: hypothetical protein VZS44_06850 [Bacilli bacterium]|nr:hypothetical protein [Bacilli bacterium]
MLIIVGMTIWSILNPIVYSTEILSDGDKYHFDDSYKVYLVNKKYGNLNIKYENAIDAWMVHAEFKRAGKTKFILESKDGEKKTFDITIRRDTYKIKEIKSKK